MESAVSTDHEIDWLLRKATTLHQTGRLAEAETAYQQILLLRPDLPNCWYNRAWCLRRLGRFAEALVAYEQALNRNIAAPEEVHLNRSVIYTDDLNRHDEAELELRKALAINPQYSPALLNLANLYEDRGARAEALRAYEALLEHDPRYWEGLARYAGLAGAETQDAPLVKRLGDALSLNEVSLEQKASIAFALGSILNRCGAYDAAFSAYAAANDYSRRSVPPQAARYQREKHEATIDSIKQVFDGRLAPLAINSDATTPIFICGMFRSGSTLVEQVLASHWRVTSGGEISVLPELVGAYLAPFPAAVANVGLSQLENVAQRYLETVRVKFPNADILTDKRPDNFLYVGLIKTLYPNAKIIHTLRNPLDNCLSAYFLHLDQTMGYALDLMDCAHYLRECRRLMHHWRGLYGSDILDFDYDAFVREPRSAVKGLLQFCGLDWDERCMSFHDRPGSVKTASVWQVREPLYQRSSGRWRRYEKHLGEAREYLSDLMPDG